MVIQQAKVVIQYKQHISDKPTPSEMKVPLLGDYVVGELNIKYH